MGSGANASGPSFMETQQEFEEAHGSPRALEAAYFRAGVSTVGESAFPNTHAHLDHGPAAMRAPSSGPVNDDMSSSRVGGSHVNVPLHTLHL